VPVRGYCCLVLKRHVVELHDLSDYEALALMRGVSRALKDVTDAIKLNMEIHGNTIPHLHAHFFPRYRGDRFEGGPIDPRQDAGSTYDLGEFQRFVNALRSGLAR
jgi:diadenosine tetraphosphate (Ap4A) HIT family hydrolase